MDTQKDNTQRNSQGWSRDLKENTAGFRIWMCDRAKGKISIWLVTNSVSSCECYLVNPF